jgi:hypothetical protein
MWSSWAWVSRIFSTVRPATVREILSTSWAGSMIMTEESLPTIHTLLSTSQQPPSSEKVPEVMTRSIRSLILRS